MSDDPQSIYSKTWDSYVTKDFPRIQSGKPRTKADLHAWQVLNTTDQEYQWPGDEWGDASDVKHILDTCVHPYVDTPETMCEIASGAGRITNAMLHSYPKAQIDCFDISQEFLNQMNLRFADQIEAGQMTTNLLNEDPKFMHARLKELGRVHKIDCLYSFDAMVHVELHCIAIYVAIAAATLKEGGLLTMNVADASMEYGFQKLLFNAPGVFRQGGAAGTHFQFAAPESMRMMLEKFGFEYDFHDCNGRDLFFSARLRDMDAMPRAFQEAGTGFAF